MSVLTLVALGMLAAALILAVAAVAAFRRKRLVGGTASLLMGLVFLLSSALAATVGIATQGYHAFTREVLAVTLFTRPTGDQTFEAVLEFPDGRRETYRLAGDQVYVDAHVLKWKPVANFLGLHTAYELDRIGGRYIELEDERARPRTLHSLKLDKPVDMFSLRQRFAVFRPLLDAEYGSASFVAADEPAEYDVTVSTSGLLIRRVPGP